MKTKPHSPTRPKSARHNGHADKDTNPPAMFETRLMLTKRTPLRIQFKASSLAEAEMKAGRLAKIVKALRLDCEAVTVDTVKPSNRKAVIHG
jgi:hypothetical protein